MITDKKVLQIINSAFPDFKGDMTECERAIGALLVGRQLGWKPLYLNHDRKTLKKYEKILGIEFREVLPEEGEYAEKSVAWLAVQKVSNFCKAVKCEIANIRTPQVN
ncbi:MAG: hypothetical protein RIF37_03980 [Rhodospirillaceae bacterium]